MLTKSKRITQISKLEPERIIANAYHLTLPHIMYYCKCLTYLEVI